MGRADARWALLDEFSVGLVLEEVQGGSLRAVIRVAARIFRCCRPFCPAHCAHRVHALG